METVDLLWLSEGRVGDNHPYTHPRRVIIFVSAVETGLEITHFFKIFQYNTSSLLVCLLYCLLNRYIIYMLLVQHAECYNPCIHK